MSPTLSWLMAVDRQLLVGIASLRHPWLDTLLAAASDVGTRGFIWLVVAGILFVFPLRRAGAWRVVLTIGFTFLLVDAIFKEFLWRARPFEVLPELPVLVTRPVTSSFPSGHAASAFAGAVATARVLPEARVLCFGLACVIAFSRLYAGVHFPTDVLAGAILGVLCAWFVVGGPSAATSQSTLPPLLRDGSAVRP
jgi:membrane-associated phospholipid phosphatase